MQKNEAALLSLYCETKNQLKYLADTLECHYSEKYTFLMLSSHLACDRSTEPVSPFPCGLREASLRRQEAAVRFMYVFTGSAASTIWLNEKFYKFEKNLSP